MPTTLKAKQMITESLNIGTIDIPSHVAWGSSSASFDETDTTLGAEEQRNGVTDTDYQSTTIQWTGTLGTAQANSVDITETGLFNDASAGDMFIRQVLYPISKTSSFEVDTIAIIRVK